MTCIGTPSVVFLALCAAGLVGCTTTIPSSQNKYTYCSTHGDEPECGGTPQVVAAAATEAPAPAPQQAESQPAKSANTVAVSCPEPANVKAGQCFSRVLYPAKFDEQTTQEIVRPAYDAITYTEPVYEDVQEQVVVREAYTREIELPALYDIYYEQVVEKPASKIWKKGRGAQERVDPNTGEVYCLVDVPAVYKTVEKKELKRPAGTRTEEIPAEYATRTVRKLVKAPQEVRTPVPAEYAAVTKKNIVKGDSCEYVEVLCEDNATQDKIREVEKALQARGQKVNADGQDDEDLSAALREFQTQQGLPVTGLMTARTLNALGVALDPVQQPSATAGTSQ